MCNIGERTLRPVQTGPKSYVLVHSRSIYAISAVESVEVETYMSLKIQSPKSQDDMDAYMTLGVLEAWDLC